MYTKQIVGFVYNDDLVIEDVEEIATIKTGGEDCNGYLNSETLSVCMHNQDFLLKRGGKFNEPSPCVYVSAPTNNSEMAALLRKLADELDKI